MGRDIKEHSLEQTEIIDIKPENELQATWKPFIHTHHYDVHDNFYDSWIAKHPRRTGEAYLNQYLNALFINDNPIPQNLSFPDLWDWFEELRIAEEKHSP